MSRNETLLTAAGKRNPEGGVATNKERLLPRRRDGEAAGGVPWRYASMAKDEWNVADACLR